MQRSRGVEHCDWCASRRPVEWSELLQRQLCRGCNSGVTRVVDYLLSRGCEIIPPTPLEHPSTGGGQDFESEGHSSHFGRLNEPE